MRVTFATSYDKMVQNLNSKLESVDRLTTMVASGKRLLSAQDDPFAWSQALNMKQGLRELDAFSTNLDFAVNWNETTEVALGSLSDLLIRAQELAVGSIKVFSTEEQTAHAAELEQIFQEALAIADTQYGDLYVFSGWYEDDGLGNMVLGASKPPFVEDDQSADYLNYQGTTGSLEVRTGKSSRQTVNLNGDSVFSVTDSSTGTTTNILKILARLRDSVSDSITSGDVKPIQDSLQLVEAAQQQITSQQALVGTRLTSLERQQQALANLTLSHQGDLAEITEADYLEVVTQLQQKQTAFEAALRVTSMLNDLNLLNFL